MTLCERHWQALREAIEERGMSALITSDADTLGKRVMQGIKSGHESVASFDPLMTGFMLIMGNTIELLGVEALMIDDDTKEGPCAICLLVDLHEKACSDPNCEADYETWVDKAAEGAADTWAQLKAGEAA